MASLGAGVEGVLERMSDAFVEIYRLALGERDSWDAGEFAGGAVAVPPA